MNDINPWILPDNAGTVMNAFRMDPAFKRAIQELSLHETKLQGSKISMMTIIFNLSTRDTLYIRNKRSSVAKRYKELKEHKRYFDIKDRK